MGTTSEAFAPTLTGRTFDTVDELETALRGEKYIADRSLATTLFLTLRLRKPLLLEGEAGVGKTEIAKVLSTILDTPLIRLQCYEGLDASAAIYEWDYPRQMLYLRTLEVAGGVDTASGAAGLFGEEFLLKRPLLQAIDAAHDRSPVLLIDEVDRADQELEAFLLELLSDFQVTVPELGTIRAEHAPIVILTSNRTREIHDALKRRCLYYWIDFPTYNKEYRILSAKVPDAPEKLRGADLRLYAGLARSGSVQAAGNGRDARLGAGAALPGNDRTQRASRSKTRSASSSSTRKMSTGSAATRPSN